MFFKTFKLCSMLIKASERVSLWCQEAHLFRHAQPVLFVRPLAKLLLLHFIDFIFMLLFFSFLLNTHRLIFCIENCHKRPILHHLQWYSWEMSHFSTLKEELSQWICDLPYSSHIIYEACSLFHIFQWQQIVHLDVLKSSENFRILLCGLHFTKSLKASWSTSDELGGLGSSVSNVSPEQNFEN